MDELTANRRNMLFAPLLAALSSGLVGSAEASPLNPAQTIVVRPDALKWTPEGGAPERSVETSPLIGATTESGLYYTLIRWWPGWMSAPHQYRTDRCCVVVSGTWWVNSGADFDPASCVPVPAGSFVHRVANTPHYDGVIRGYGQPVIIAICGMGPVDYKLLDPSQPRWRSV